MAGFLELSSPQIVHTKSLMCDILSLLRPVAQRQSRGLGCRFESYRADITIALSAMFKSTFPSAIAVRYLAANRAAAFCVLARLIPFSNSSGQLSGKKTLPP